MISTDENQVFVAVQEWYQTDTYNLYQSDPRGVHYALVLEDVRSSRQAEESVVIDILEVGPPSPVPVLSSHPATPAPAPLSSVPVPHTQLGKRRLRVGRRPPWANPEGNEGPSACRRLSLVCRLSLGLPSTGPLPARLLHDR